MMLLPVHIAAGCVGIVTGYTALFAGKGTRLHRRSGMGFLYAMLVMGTTASIIAAMPGVEQSVWSGLIAVYLVSTAVITVKPLPDRFAWLNVVGMVFALTAGILSIGSGLQAMSLGGSLRGVPGPMFFQFAVLLILAAWGDFRIIRSGPLTGTARLVRHIWRICYSLFIATGSFFLGQSDEFPEMLRHPLLIVPPAIAPLILMFYWLWRVRIRKSIRGFVFARSIAPRLTIEPAGD